MNSVNNALSEHIYHMRAEKKNVLTPPSRNRETSCSNGNISQTTGRNFIWILPDESTPHVLVNGVIFNTLRPVV